MAAPERILELIERFKFNEDSYRSGNYNETQLRREFLDPFFEELGWDVLNRQSYAEAYKDVIHEDAIKIGSVTKAPDYCFRIGGARKFFLEAKKPSVNIKDDISPAFQLRRYAWSAKLPLSILSDFEEFAVYDCRIEPVKTDKASTARIFYCRYTDYADKWDEIAGIFSKQAILKGSFDKYAAGKNRKGTQEVDAAFLKEIETWREALAKNLALRNPELTTRELNFAVQRTIDRIIFLRICEARGIERHGQLQELLKSNQVYQDLAILFHRADDRYNSGLFHFRKEKDRLEPPDDLTLTLSLDDKPLKDIIRKLYYPDSPYEFSVLPADILGQVYEQFLGKVIRLTAGHQAKVEEKPEVRKAGGVYYTPTYIVDYIVNQTVGKLCENKTPKEVAKLRVLDPACGSGSFLLGAYQFLLDWHREWHTQNDPEKSARGKNPAVVQTASGEWRLTTPERKRILLNNIYGVDIDAQAVETTKLSLLLKVLEGETAETIGQNLRLFQERALPDLANNIKCGNSLIGHDLYEQQRLAFFEDEDKIRINAFDWKDEFAAIMKVGGFDAVIGNPPYGGELSAEERKYLTYKFNVGTTDTAALMMIQAQKLGGTRGGLSSMIVPKPFTYSSNWQQIRLRLLPELTELVDVGKVWKEVKLEQIIYRLHHEQEVEAYRSAFREAREIKPLGEIQKSGCHHFGFILNGINQDELKIGLLMSAGKLRLGQLIQNIRGGMFQQSVSKHHGKFAAIGGKQIGRYSIQSQKGYISAKADLSENAIIEPDSLLVQNIVAHITSPRDHIKIIGTIATTQIAETCRILDTVNQIKNLSEFSSHYLLGLLLSKPLNWYVYRFIYAKAIRTMHFDGPVSDRIPIPNLNLQSRKDRKRHDRMTELVEQMLALHQKLAAAKTTHEQTLLQRQIDATDRQIDRLVYELYELTEEEIRVVEQSANKE